MKPFQIKGQWLIISVGLFIFLAALISLIYGRELAAAFDVIGIRIATLIVAFASFISSSFFSLLIFTHNRTVSRINDDANKRGEMFRELQFASSNYSIIEFMDRMLLYEESTRYIDKVTNKHNFAFHMIERSIQPEDVMNNPQNYRFTSLKIPFRVLEGKTISQIASESIVFERSDKTFLFTPIAKDPNTPMFLLYNERTKRNNVIVNLITMKTDNFFISSQINTFTKIKISIRITSLLGVTVKGNSELYFTNPEQLEGDGTNTYKINTSNFTLTELPRIEQLDRYR